MTTPKPPRTPSPPTAVRIPRRPSGTPLVSCVLPTANRPDWLRQAIAYFHRQDYPTHARELIVVDDGDVDPQHELRDLLGHPAITHVRPVARASIGAKRNLGTARARGDVLVQWDDDDWYGPQRISRQLAPIVAGTADITGLRDAIWFDVEGWRFHRPTPAHHRRLFVQDVSGGSLVFHRALWERGVRYPDVSLAEDAAFVNHAVRRGARLARLPADDVYVYVRHRTNSWQLRARDQRTGWQAVPEPEALSAHPHDRAFYRARSAVGSPPPEAAAASVPTAERITLAGAASPAATGTAAPGVGQPTVSCIMPTADRHAFLSAAIDRFLAQRYDDAELVVVDDGDQPAEHLMPDHPRVRYLRLDHRRLLGEKRNLAVEASLGEIIVHFDDDDWSHPDRLAVQVAALAESGAGLCGLARMLWWDPEHRVAWRYTSPRLHRPWVAGNTLAYRRDAWRRAPFPAQATGEDTAFIWADRHRRIQVLDDERLVIGVIHRHNTSPKNTRSTAWTRVDPVEVLRVMEEADDTGGEDALSTAELTAG